MFKIGDVVMFKSGGPHQTVIAVSEDGTGLTVGFYDTADRLVQSALPSAAFKLIGVGETK